MQKDNSTYYGIIKSLKKYNFVGNKNLKIVFVDCDWLDPSNSTRENKFGMAEVKHSHRLRGCNPFVLVHEVEQVYYMSYPCEKLSAWWVVYRVNPREQLQTPDDSGYHEKQCQLERLMRFINMMNCRVHFI
jgi:hypothetical protein